MGQQLEIAEDQAQAAKGAATAAKWSAVATVAIVILTAILAFVAARPLFAPESSDISAVTPGPEAAKDK